MPSVFKASSMCWVSSERRTPSSSVSPSANAASNSARLETLLEPGKRTVPVARATGARSRKSGRAGIASAGLDPLVTRVARVAQQGFELLELRHIGVQLLAQPRPVVEKNVAPHFGIAAGDARKVAKPSGGEA